MSTSVVLLAYKEAENLKILLPQIHKVMEKLKDDYEVIVIDSAKPLDNTKEVCEKNNTLYYPQEEPGYAGAFRTGIKYVTKKRMLVLDADGSHNPKNIADISRMFDRGGYDIVIGSRYTKGGVSNDSKTSYIMSKILNTTMRLCLGIRAKDISTSYRMYDAKQIKAVTLTRNNFDVLQEVILLMKINKREQGKKLNIGETPITFNKRMYGESKRQLLKFIRGYIVTLFMLIRINLVSLLKRSKKK